MEYMKQVVCVAIFHRNISHTAWKHIHHGKELTLFQDMCVQTHVYICAHVCARTCVHTCMQCVCMIVCTAQVCAYT